MTRFLLPAAGAALALVAGLAPAVADGLDVDRLAALQTVRSVAIAPDGSTIAYGLEVQRRPGVDEDGSAWRELHVVDTEGTSRAFTHRGNLNDIAFTPDGHHITFLAKRGDDEQKALWAIPVAGGEARRLLEFESGAESYAVSPQGDTIAWRIAEPPPEARKTAKEQGFDREIFEEEVQPIQVWLAPLPAYAPPPRDPSAPAAEAPQPRKLALEGSVDEMRWTPDGEHLVVTVQPRNLIDDRYTRRSFVVVKADSAEIVGRVDNEGKLGNFDVSPDGAHIAMIKAADLHDPREGRLAVVPIAGGTPRDLLPGLEAHVTDFAWVDADTLLAVIAQGVETIVAEVDLDGSRRDRVVSGKGGGPLVEGLAVAENGTAALRAERPTHPAEVYLLPAGADEARRLTDSNPWLADVELGRQEVFTWTASDGLELEGVLIHPLDGTRPAPTILMVHGGPEAHDSNGWLTSYGRPGQTAAARGYAVLYPNYRGSTGRGVAFSKTSQSDAAGAEFRDLAEAADALVAAGIAAEDKMGITGASYGGYATAWAATYYTERFAAGVMMVGISNKISKGFTTDIPTEDFLVHTRFKPWTKWQFSLERSPLYYAEQSRTPLLIGHGQEDTRVHPSQSLQLYRALKLIDKTPVRYVRYPGEGHGNRRAASRYEHSIRLLRWFDHFMVDGATELPPVDLPSHTADDEAEPTDG
ncbi:MAG: S9 family peptidase [Acidobacteriota bacterium]